MEIQQNWVKQVADSRIWLPLLHGADKPSSALSDAEAMMGLWFSVQAMSEGFWDTMRDHAFLFPWITNETSDGIEQLLISWNRKPATWWKTPQQTPKGNWYPKTVDEAIERWWKYKNGQVILGSLVFSVGVGGRLIPAKERRS